MGESPLKRVLTFVPPRQSSTSTRISHAQSAGGSFQRRVAYGLLSAPTQRSPNGPSVPLAFHISIMDLVVPSSCGPSRMRDFVNQLDSTVDRSRENRSA